MGRDHQLSTANGGATKLLDELRQQRWINAELRPLETEQGIRLAVMEQNGLSKKPNLTIRVIPAYKWRQEATISEAQRQMTV